MRICVIGAGLAGKSAARAAIEKCRVTIIEKSREPVPPKSLWFDPLIQDKFSSNYDTEADMMFGTEALLVSNDGKVKTNGGTMSFDKVIVCVGTHYSCKRFKQTKECVIYLEKMNDFQEFFSSIGKLNSISICGGGYPLLEILSKIQYSKNEITLFSSGFEPIFPKQATNFIHHIISDNGIRVVDGYPERPIGESRLEAVIANGLVYRTEVLCVLPNIIPVPNPVSGTQEYVKTDKFMRFSKNIYAAGTCAMVPIGRNYFRIFQGLQAKTSGFIAGLNCFDCNLQYQKNVMFGADIFGNYFLSSGLRLMDAFSSGYDALEYSHVCKECFLALTYGKNLELLGAFYVGHNDAKQAVDFLASSINRFLPSIYGHEFSHLGICSEKSLAEIFREIFRMRKYGY